MKSGDRADEAEAHDQADDPPLKDGASEPLVRRRRIPAVAVAEPRGAAPPEWLLDEAETWD